MTFLFTTCQVGAEAALKAAKVNRGELEKVFRHYEDLGDRQKLEAARFLIANMEGRGYIVTGLYADARRTRLGTEKFSLDGTHTGTGGGNHIVIGGPTPLPTPVSISSSFSPRSAL